MNTFQFDSLKFDQNLSMDEQEKNIILSTGLNKQNIGKLAKKIFSELIEKIHVLDSTEEEDNFAQNNMSDIICLAGICNFHYEVTGISTNEPGGLSDLKSELVRIVHFSPLNRRKSSLLCSLVSESKQLTISEMFIRKHQEQRKALEESTPSGSTALMTDEFELNGFRRLRLVYADVVSRYLSEMRTEKTENIKENTSIKALEVIEPVKLQESPNWEVRKNITGFVREGFPFTEGFPKCSHGDSRTFELITQDGKKHTAYVDFSTQYREEGIQWRIILSDTLNKNESVNKHIVIAWRELMKESDILDRTERLEEIAKICEDSQDKRLVSFSKLIRTKGQISIVDNHGYSLLRFASSIGNSKITTLIFELLMLHQKSPSPEKIINEMGSNGYTGFMEAVWFGDIETINLWLVNPYLDLGAHNQGNLSLQFQNIKVHDLIIAKMQEQGVTIKTEKQHQ